jgi:hypothetical protein
MDKTVFVNSSKYGPHTRRAPRPGLKKDEPALMQQFSRTKILNDLAGDLNSVFRGLWPGKKSDLYQKMLKRFRKEQVNSRGLLLMQLKSMDINPRYSLNRLGNHPASVEDQGKQFSVGLKVGFHPPRGKYWANCYYYEVILFSWKRKKEKASWSRQFGDWIRLGNDKPQFEFYFPKPKGTIQWMLCLRIHLGKNLVVIDHLETTGMQIIDVGTFDKQELRVLQQRNPEKEANKEQKPKQPDIVRVKAKKQE